MAIFTRVCRLFRPESPVEIDISDRARGDVIETRPRASAAAWRNAKSSGPLDLAGRHVLL